MKRVRYSWLCAGKLILLLVLSVWIGCSTKTASKPMEESRLKPLALLYGQYTGQHMGKAPANEEVFRKFVSQQTSFLQQFKISDPSQLFISERDGKPYRVVYAGETSPGQLLGAPIVAWEQDGVNGKRFVGNTLGAVKEVSEEEFRQLIKAP
ncbi:MAG: hypothetical protein ACUVTH_04110 [Thermogutta sp.]